MHVLPHRICFRPLQRKRRGPLRCRYPGRRLHTEGNGLILSGCAESHHGTLFHFWTVPVDENKVQHSESFLWSSVTLSQCSPRKSMETHGFPILISILLLSDRYLTTGSGERPSTNTLAPAFHMTWPYPCQHTRIVAEAEEFTTHMRDYRSIIHYWSL